jgi:uncharacterized membrane protein
VRTRGACPAAPDAPEELRSTKVRPAASCGPSTSPLGVMRSLSNRILLVASYCLMSINMAIEVTVHPDAKDHVGSITGLAFCIATLIALVWDLPARWNHAVTVLNVLIAIVGAYLIALYLYSHGVTWAEAPDLMVRIYLTVVVPAVAVCYFVFRARGANAGGHDA